MATKTTRRRYPAGVGCGVGMAFGFLAGAVAWWVSGEILLFLVLFAATGSTFGVTLENALDTTPLTPRQRRFLFLVASLGLVVGSLVFLAVVVRG
jgi:hypothetical protein